MKRNADIKYGYKSMSVPSGGFVTGFIFHPTCKTILYYCTDKQCLTDIWIYRVNGRLFQNKGQSLCCNRHIWGTLLRSVSHRCIIIWGEYKWHKYMI